MHRAEVDNAMAVAAHDEMVCVSRSRSVNRLETREKRKYYLAMGNINTAITIEIKRIKSIEFGNNENFWTLSDHQKLFHVAPSFTRYNTKDNEALPRVCFAFAKARVEVGGGMRRGERNEKEGKKKTWLFERDEASEKELSVRMVLTERITQMVYDDNT